MIFTHAWVQVVSISLHGFILLSCFASMFRAVQQCHSRTDFQIFAISTRCGTAKLQKFDSMRHLRVSTC